MSEQGQKLRGMSDLEYARRMDDLGLGGTLEAKEISSLACPIEGLLNGAGNGSVMHTGEVAYLDSMNHSQWPGQMDGDPVAYVSNAK